MDYSLFAAFVSEFNSFKFNYLLMRWQKNGSFGFAKGRLVCWAKPNVPFVRLAKIVFKKCALGKNKNTEALAFGSAV